MRHSNKLKVDDPWVVVLMLVFVWLFVFNRVEVGDLAPEVPEENIDGPVPEVDTEDHNHAGLWMSLILIALVNYREELMRLIESTRRVEA